MEKDNDYTALFCPSFSSYANDGLAETAERVRLECSGEFNDDDDDDSFEFVNLRLDSETVAVPFSGDCELVFPVFNQAITSAVKPDESSRAEVTTKLGDLFLRDREDSSSSSSDEEKELDGVPSEVYCPWTPEKPPNGGWRKSKSTGSSSSRRWRIRDLLRRSFSEGKQSLGFLNSSNSTNRDESTKKEKKKEEKVSSAHEKFYLKKKAKTKEEKRRSYLPYKQHLFCLFSFNVHHRYGNTVLSS